MMACRPHWLHASWWYAVVGLDVGVKTEVSLQTVDRWVGATLFIPLIVRICQTSGQSQFAISRLFWFIVALEQLRIAQTLVGQIVAGVFSIIMMLTASLRSDMPAYSMRGFRIIAMALLALDVFHGKWSGVEIWALILFAEYAATIRTIPPKSIQKTARPTEAI